MFDDVRSRRLFPPTASGAEMTRTDVALRLSELTDLDLAKLPDDAVSQVLQMIGELNPSSSCYESNVETILSLGAVIWTFPPHMDRVTSGV